MNIIEAVQSHKKFKRKLWKNWYTMANFYQGELILCPLDIISSDWEVQNNTVTITSDDFAAAVQKVTNTVGTGPCINAHISEYVSELQKELGL